LSLLPAGATFLALSGWMALAGSAHGAPNSVGIQPNTATLEQAGAVVVSLSAEAPPTGLGAWEIDVKYDSSVLAVTACTSHASGACNNDFSPGTVRSSGQSADANLTGSLTLAEITFQVPGPLSQCTPLDVQVTAFVDGDDVSTSPATNDGQVCPSPATPLPAPTPTPAPEAPPCDRLSEFDPENFSDSTNIDNQWLPVTPGKELVLEGVEDGEPRRVVFIATDLIKVINDVTTVVVWQSDFADEQLKETELTFFAQDDAGNVWNLGRYIEEFESGQFLGAPNTWIAGSADAEGGVQMPADPVNADDTYLQGWAPEIDFLQCAGVIASGNSICVPLQCFQDVLVTEEHSPLDPASGHQRKYHAAGVGLAQQNLAEDPSAETISLEFHRQLEPDEVEAARSEALKLEERAYLISEAYGETSPAEVTPATEGTPAPAPVPALVLDPTPKPRSLAAVLAAVPESNGSTRPRFLPSAGGAWPVDGSSPAHWMIPLGLGVALLAAYGRGFLQRGTARSPDEETVTLRRIAQRRPSEMTWVREVLRQDRRAHSLRDGNSNVPSSDWRSRND
jgi:hypothetical protein